MNQKVICCASQKMLHGLLCWTPARFREWGTAMAAELEAIDHPVELLHWSLGCVGIILRQAIWNICLGACCGAWFWITAKEEGISVRNARMIAVSALLIALGFFLAPSFRQGMSVAADTLDYASWSHRDNSTGEREPERLRINAERERDARMLAYLAIHEDRLDLAAQDADHAVAIDPRWTWVYYVLIYRGTKNWSSRPNLQTAVWAKKLREWDPQNAVNYLVDAETNYRITERNQVLDEKRSRGRYVRYVDQRTGNRPWMEMMARAFDAPKYNSYFQERFDLERDVARQLGSDRPLRLTISMMSHPLPSVIGCSRYERFILSNATNPPDLVQQTRRVIAFGERMMAADTEFEQFIGRSVALDGYKKLQPMAAPADQAFLGARIVQLEIMQHARIGSGITLALAMNARIVETCFVLILLAAMTMAASAAVFIFRRMRKSRAIGIVSYAAVGIMLLASIVAFVAYLPYSQLVAQAMDSRTPVKVGLPLLGTLGSFGMTFLYSVKAHVYGWSILLALLSLAGLWLVVRQFRKPPARPAVVSAG